MSQRIDFVKAPAAAVKGMYGLQAAVDHSGLEHSLLDLVSMRASQINRCAYCLDMHSKDALARGETDQRLFALDAWRETPFFTDRERAALLWCETLTLVSKRGVPDKVYDVVRKEFSEEELAYLTLAVVAINSWNRLMIGFQADVGGYDPAKNPKLKRETREKAESAV